MYINRCQNIVRGESMPGTGRYCKTCIRFDKIDKVCKISNTPKWGTSKACESYKSKRGRPSGSKRLIDVRYCVVCGTRLSPSISMNVCSEDCAFIRERMLKGRLDELRRQERLKGNQISDILNELNLYNEAHQSNLSYGQYMAMRKEV